MKAWILHNPNNMTYEETEKPQPNQMKSWLRLRQRASVVLIFHARCDRAHVHPIIIGHEFPDRSVCVDRMWTQMAG